MHHSTLFLITLVGVAAMSAAESAHREKIEWCNIRWENTTDPKLPRVLLVGDSITLGYSGHAKKLLAGKANVHYGEKGKAMQARAVADAIAAQLGK